MALTNPLYNNLPKLANIQGFWRLEETSGSRADLSSNNNTLTDNNTVLYAAGKIGNAADFEKDTSEYLSRTDAAQAGLDITGVMTICAWIKPESIAAMFLVSKWNSETTNNRAYSVYVDASNKLNFRITTNGAEATQVTTTSSTSIASGSWQHIAARYNGSNLAVFINGLQNGTPTDFTDSIYDSNKAFMLGSIDGTPAGFYDGLMDEVIIWNTNLTDAEILKVYNIDTLAKYKKGGGFFLFM